MKPQKIRFTVWLDPATLEAAKVRSRQDRVSVSEALALAATESLLRNRADAEAQIVKAVERVFHLVHRTDKKRGFDQQVLKEMVGLMVLSFFNHTPAVPEAGKKAALLDGKVRFHRFLDTLAANLRGGKSIVSDLPTPPEEMLEQNPPVAETKVAATKDSAESGNAMIGEAGHKRPRRSKTVEPGATPEPDPEADTGPAKSEESAAEKIPVQVPTPESKPPEPESAPPKKRWGLFN